MGLVSRPDSVPRELFEVQTEQLMQALQAIAALALTEEEVAECRHAHGFTEFSDRAWAKSMREDMLAPGGDGREALLDMLRRHEFLTNSHAGFIYGAFEGPQITYVLADHANQLAEMITSYEESDLDGEPEYGDALRDTFATQLRAQGVPDEHITYLMRCMGVRIATAPLNRMRRARRDAVRDA